MIRLNKLMSERGICSRREADSFIEQRQVLVDGELIVEQGTKVSCNAKITLLPQAKKDQETKVTVLLNKPLYFVSTQPEKDYRAAIELITAYNQFKCPGDLSFSHSHRNKLAVAGRLDIDSTGLLVMTQDGSIAKQIIGENSDIEKEYLVRVEGFVNDRALDYLCFGLELDGEQLRKAEVTLLQDGSLKFILKQGKKRQIRRMCELVNLKVIGLKRIRIGKILLGTLPVGKWRYLKTHEEF